MNRRDFLNFPLKGIKNNKEEKSNVQEKNTVNNLNQPNNTDLTALASDFTEEMLFIEVMKMGIDPASLSQDQMLRLVFNKLEKKPSQIEVKKIK